MNYHDANQNMIVFGLLSALGIALTMILQEQLPLQF